MRTIAVAHHKGGTAKTTTTVNLASALAESGHRVLVIDMDPQGSASVWLGVRDAPTSVIDAIRGERPLTELVYETTAPGVQLVPASPGLSVSGPDAESATALGFIQAMEALPPLWDFVLVDCPPSLGYLGVAPLAVCGEVLVPVEAHVLALVGLSSLLETISRARQRLNPDLRITGVLACRVTRTTHSRLVVDRLAHRFPETMLRTQIRENVRLAEAPGAQMPVTTYAPDSHGAEDYRALAAELAPPAPGSARVIPGGVTVSIMVPEPTAPSYAARLTGVWMGGRRPEEVASSLLPIGILLLAAVLRIWQLNAVGFNTDEAVYSGQAASLANDRSFTSMFPIFRAHPLLLQFVLAGMFVVTGVSDANARLVGAAIGVFTVYLVYRLGRSLYDRRVGLIAALFLAVMPYHVIVTRQVLLDGPMTMFATLALYTVAKYALTGERTWLFASGAAMGLTFLSKETGVVLLGAIFAFFAVAPAVPVRVKELVVSLLIFLAVVAAFPLALILGGGGGSSTAQQYLLWQLFRLPNHDIGFYLETVPSAVGMLVIGLALVGLLRGRLRVDWRERLLLVWILVVVIFFVLWPVKGFQYLLPAVSPAVVLAARGAVALGQWQPSTRLLGRPARLARGLARSPAAARVLRPFTGLRERVGALVPGPRSGRRVGLIAGIVALSLLVETVPRLQPASTGQLLAGGGGVRGGREAGLWIRDNTPGGAQVMTIGPSMANIVQFYGHRKSFGLSVSPNPLRRNPSYDALQNPDLQIRTNALQYIVWDAYSAARSGYFEARLLDYMSRYHGRAIHTETLPGSDQAVIIVYEVAG
ncbi:MAG: AAA family ATPase [Candidatus Limnocylindrales bacterium]